jgi:hypothetical protein
VKRILLLVFVNLAVFCIAAEALALVIFYYEHGWLFYADPYRPTIALVEERSNEALTAVGLHPYFGPTHRPGIPFDLPPELHATESGPVAETNNFGFTSRYDYPLRKTTERQFVVGVFGGSVSAFFCRVATARFEEDLRQHPFFKDRELVTLCFSHEGYKQPQQLLVLSYFLSLGQPLDLVINIDGFNEVALGAINDRYGWDVSMPSHEHLDPLINLVNQATLTPAKLDSLARIQRDRRWLNGLAEWGNRTPFASAEFVLRHLYQIVARWYRADVVRFDALPSNPPQASLIHVTPKTRDRAGSDVFSSIAADWTAASILMNQLLTARGVRYLHVLQPNQYYTSRRFADGEQKVAVNPDSPFKPGVERGYPLLEKALEPDGVNAIHIFDDERGAVYVDDCCHFTLTGNRILADAVAKAVLARLPSSVGPAAAAPNPR